jgi:hypothetical protein
MLTTQAFNGSPSPESAAGLLGLLALVACGIWLFVRWLKDGPATPDPWDQDVAEALEKEQAGPLCHRCLSPHDDRANFCATCGAPVGIYTNWLPYPYLFSIGHTMRIGTSGEFRRSPLTIAGFFLLGLAEYTIFAPVYWFVFIRGLCRPLPPRIQDIQYPPSAPSPM